MEKLTLFVVHGSHPCTAVMKALELKGLDYRVIEWPPPLHAPMQQLLFGKRTVPALRIGSEKVSGSRAIMRRLDELVPDPPLLPADPDHRARVLEAERWGDEVLQPYGRTLIWAGFSANPASMVSYSEHSRLPFPAPAIRAIGPGIAMMQRKLNHTDADTARKALAELPPLLDHVDQLIADGTIGGEQPNAADLQILSTLRLMLTMDDVRVLIEDRPCGRRALELWPSHDGRIPAGSIG